MRIDLHIHTKYSDGEVYVQQAISSLFSDYRLVAFADHEHIFDPSEFAVSNSAKFISGVEICCHHKGQNIEILGYDFDAKNADMVALVDKVREMRIVAIKEILTKNGFSTENLPANPFRINVPLPDGVDRHEFWKQYNSEYRAKCHSVPAIDVIETIIAARGIPVLAHPMESLAGKSGDDVEMFLLSLRIHTVELITPKHRKEDVTLINSIIERNNLSASIGSDSHKSTLTEILHGYDINERKFEWIRKLSITDGRS